MDAEGLKLLLLETGQRGEDEWPPLGLGYISAFLKKHIEDISIKIATEDQERYINEFQPDIVGITSVSQDYGHAGCLAKLCKDKKIPVIVGGAHISSLPKSLTPDMDVGVLGQGEETALELVRIFLKNRSFHAEQLSAIKGVIYRDSSGNVVHTGWPSLPVNMDYIPFPERVSIPKNKMLHLLTSRGCRYRCRFCTPAILSKNIRFFSAEYVIDEIKHYIAKYNANEFFIFDDQFIENIQRIEKMAQIIERDNLSSKINLIVNARANLVNEEILMLLKRLGVRQVALGLESMSPKTLRYLKGPSIKVEDNIKAVKLLKKSGFFVTPNIIIGSPHETRDEILKSINFLLENKIYDSYIYLLTPLPGTAVWEYAKSRGLVSEDENMDWQKIGFSRKKGYIYEHNFGKNVVLSETLSRDELYSLYKYFLKKRKVMVLKERAKRFLKRRIRQIITDKVKDRVKLYLNKKGLLLKTYRLLNSLGLIRKDALIKLTDSGVASPPTILEYEITDRCNLNCSFCIFKDKIPCVNELSAAEIKKFIEKLPKTIEHVYITGGEPFLRKDIVEIVGYFDKAGIDCTILTNGTILSEDIADGLSRFKHLRGITVSLDSLGPLHDSIRGKKGTLKAVLDTIEKLKKRRVYINIVTTLLKDNLGEVEKIAGYAKKNKLNYFIQPENVYLSEDALKTSHILDPAGKSPNLTIGRKGENSLHKVPISKIKDTISKIKNLGIDSSTGAQAFWIMPQRYLNNTIRNCGLRLTCLDYNTLHVDSCGDIIACMAIRKPFGNILKDDAMVLWNSDEYRNFRLTLIKNNLLPICSQCCKMDILR